MAKKLKRNQKSNLLLTASLFFLIFSSQFNITLRLEEFIFGYSPYSRGLLINYLVPHISIIDIAFTFVFFSVLLHSRTDITKLFKNKVLLIVVFYLFIHNLYFHNTLTALISLRYFLYFITSYLLYQHLKVSSLKIPIILIASSSLFQGILGLLQYLKSSSLNLFFLGESKIGTFMPNIAYIDIDGELFLRAYGTFPHPNVLAGYLLLSLNVIIIGYIYNLLPKKYLAITPLIALLALFTFSRIALVLMCLSFALLLLKHRPFESNLSLAFISSIESRFKELFSLSSNAFSERIDLISVAVFIIDRFPIAGVGIGMFTSTPVENALITERGLPFIQPVHNIFLLFIAENGVFVSAILLFSIIYSLYYRFKSLQTREWCISLWLLMIIVSIGSTDHYLLTLPQGLFIFSGLVMLMSVVQMKGAPSAPPSTTHLK